MWGDIAIAFLLAFITAFVLTPYTMRLAKKVGAIDVPNDRRVNKKPMPRLRRLISYLHFICSMRQRYRCPGRRSRIRSSSAVLYW